MKSKSRTPPLATLIEERQNRRSFLRTTSATLAALPFTSLFGCTKSQTNSPQKGQGDTKSRFEEVPQGIDAYFHVSPNYKMQTLLRWGDPILPDASPFNIGRQSPKSQSGQFGTHCDFLAFLPLPLGSQNSNHGLLCVNHEFVSAHMMFPGFPGGWYDALEHVTQKQSETLMAASGHSVVEIRKQNDKWEVIPGSFNRRITLLDTAISIEGPVRGHPKLQTKADPLGVQVIGTLANCSGGVTPWGTLLLCEENIEHYFADTSKDPKRNPHHDRYGLYSSGKFPYFRYQRRFRLNEEANEANRYGWVVEYDPYAPNKSPVKRTALGRVPREGATTVLAPSGHVVIYSGDDHHFEYLYRFVSEKTYNPTSRVANLDLLNQGTLSVAQFSPDGTLRWLPLVFGTGPLTPKNGFENQADLLIQTRQAADLLGATPMDRPEGIAVNPITGNVYVMLTKNKKRTKEEAAGPNPIAYNQHGHILEIIPPKTNEATNHEAKRARWDILLAGGDPTNPEHHAQYNPRTTGAGALANPDNATFDSTGQLWISTDGAEKSLGSCDGLWACETDGPHRAMPRRFIRVPHGAELCSPCFTPDETTLFVSVQHPGEDKHAHFAKPTTRWPDFRPDLPPRSSVVAITHTREKKIGS